MHPLKLSVDLITFIENFSHYLWYCPTVVIQMKISCSWSTSTTFYATAGAFSILSNFITSSKGRQSCIGDWTLHLWAQEWVGCFFIILSFVFSFVHVFISLNVILSLFAGEIIGRVKYKGQFQLRYNFTLWFLLLKRYFHSEFLDGVYSPILVSHS